MIIKKGILPNIYINNIEIYDTHIKYDVFVTDQQIGPTWSNKKSLEHLLKLKHTVVSDQTKLDDISNGNDSFSQYDTGTKTESVFFMKKSPINGISSLNNQTCYVKTCSYKLTKEIKNITIFANLFIDGIAQQGPIVSETVFTNGVLNTTTNILLKNKEHYYGPTHYHEGVYMEGKTHTESSHSALEIISALNMKIKDYRTKNFVLKSADKGGLVPIISNLLVSFDENTNHNYIFFINLEELLITKTKLGYLYSRLSDLSKETILNNIKFKTIRIKRHSVRERTKQIIKTINILSGFESNDDRYSATSGNKFEFISHRLGSEIRAVKFYDNTLKSNLYGTYQYELEISFNDETTNFFKEFVNRASSALERVEYFRDLLLRPNMYDYQIRMPKDQVSLSTFVLNDIATNVIYLFNDIKIFLYSMTDQEIEADLFRNYNLINAKSCTMESVGVFIKECRDIYNKLISFCGIEGIKIGRNYRYKLNISRAHATNRIFINHKFKNIVNPSNSKFHYTFSKEEINFENISEETSPENISEAAPNSHGSGYSSRPEGHKSGGSSSKYPSQFGTAGNQYEFQSTGNPFMNSALKESFSETTAASSVTVGSYGGSGPDGEKHENATEYLGTDSTFNIFSSQEGCQTIKNEPIIADDLEVIISTETDNIQEEMKLFTTKLQILRGFRTNKYNKIIITQPIWSDYDGGSIDSTIIMKQKVMGDIKPNIDYSFPNQYTLLNNIKIYKFLDAKLNRAQQKTLANIVSLYTTIDPLFTQSKLVNHSTPEITVANNSINKQMGGY